MTKLLEKAFEEASKLSQAEQNALAAMVLDELASDKRWEDSFSKSQEKLDKLSEEALAEFKSGKTKPMDPDRL